MVNITPIQFTSEEVMSTILKVVVIEDDLQYFARFNWTLFTSTMTLIDTGICLCDGTDYSGWDGNRTFPYTFVANQLGLEII